MPFPGITHGGENATPLSFAGNGADAALWARGRWSANRRLVSYARDTTRFWKKQTRRERNGALQRLHTAVGQKELNNADSIRDARLRQPFAPA